MVWQTNPEAEPRVDERERGTVSDDLSDAAGISRRQALKRVGVTTAIAVPAVRAGIAAAAPDPEQADAIADSLGGVRGPPRPATSPQPPPQTAAVAGDPAVVGSWSGSIPGPFPIVGIHAVLLRTGKVLLLENLIAYVLDPLTNTGAECNPPAGADLFCAGHAHLPTGEILWAGGRLVQRSRGPRWVYVFSPDTLTWTRMQDMRAGRWYPTVTTLPDGRAMIATGNDENGLGNPDVEVYANGTVAVVTQMPLEFYPKQLLLPNGKVLVADFNGQTRLLDPSTWTFTSPPKLREKRRNSGGVLLPGPPSGSYKAMVFGGYSGGDANPTYRATTETFDATTPTVRWKFGPPMPQPRAYMNPVLLPDGTVLGVGGENLAGPTRDTLLFNPAAGTWTTLATESEIRGYHSTAILLPDGRVLSAGDNQPPGGLDRIEYYSPPYLFRGARPTITSAPAQVTWGQTFTVGTVGTVTRAVLMAPGAMTHSNNMGQRHVELAITTQAGGISATAPPNANVAPPGHYMLFVLNNLGVPSVASWMKVA